VESLRVPGRVIPKHSIGCALLLCAFARAADPPPIVPLTVCEVVSDLAAHEGKNYAVIGRYSYRRDGRWIGEDGCGSGTATLWLSEDSAAAPRPPANYELDASALNKKFSEMQKHTSLGKFRFGTPDYDRWAVVFGRVELRKGDDAKKAPADLVFRGSGTVMFLTADR